ncbi:hypothetical protein A9G41_03145 [Gilliamella sp. Nev5-1]|uniref:glutathione S-transferase N-terminal domain-containing protein n=1 Tax=unclassified Gilliamella TaxID=2685620 RepID=UPI00080E6D36|nr:glutathione S-transferase N-terminal domain-containing protein [Gilliamella apicola]OCG61145.1 hypothetical protein A9G40_01500 [Gilliamella apicola]OCG71160.1 hypothetical protein A9G41_03145 [Gilliamella apicola]
MNIKLIGNKTSPFVRKVEIVLQEQELLYDFQLDSPWESASKVVGINPIGKIPVLIIGGETTLFDSSLIVEFLLKMVPNTELSSKSETLNDKLLMTVANAALDTAVLCSWELKRPNDKVDSNVMNKYKRRIESCLRYMNGVYSVEKDTFSMSDVSALCCIDYLLLRNFVPLIEEDYRNLFNRRKQLYTRQSVKTTSPLPNSAVQCGGHENA